MVPRVGISAQASRFPFVDSSIAYLEIASPGINASADFCTQKFGMRITDRTEGAAYLRCWGDYYRYSLIIRKGQEPALTNIG